MAFSRLVLVDGTAVAYRAFYAIRDLATSKGQPTNAVFGFIRMLNQLRDVWLPSHWAVIFDAGINPQKLRLLEEYKAQRPGMPEALVVQMPLIGEYLHLAEICQVSEAGEEADDVLASLVERAEKVFDQILIATSDKDMYQLVNAKTRLIPVSGLGELIGPEEVRSRTGVRPEQIVEWLALVGDSADNIPGVPGIGPKTAARLLEEYGSLEKLKANADALPSERIRRSLREHWDLVRRNTDLVRLNRELPCRVNWDDLVLRRQNPARLASFFERLELRSLAKRSSAKDWDQKVMF